MVRRSIALVVAAGLAASACSGSGSGSGVEEPAAAGSSAANRSTSTTIENYPDAQTRALANRARERRPVPNSALPPRHLEPERHPQSLVDRFAIVSGGPPPDGIPSIDAPSFVPVDAVDWLASEEPVAVLTIGDTTRIYPTQILIWHEIVNDEIDGQAITMTYCPLCNSVVAFTSTVTGPDGETLTLDFGTSGALYQSALVMYDRQTESLWTHFDGRAVIGDLMGSELPILPAAMVSWADAAEANPEARVLDRPTGRAARPYGTAPYPNYETADPSPGYLSESVDDRLEEKQRVVGVEAGGRRLAIDRRALANDGVVTFELDGRELVALFEPGTTSALDGEAIAGGLDVGAVGVFDASLDDRELSFEPGPSGAPTDRETGSTWSVLGRATAGPLAGRRLEPVAHIDTFWFAWARYHPDTDVLG